MNNSKEFINTSKLIMLTDDKNALFVHIIIFVILIFFKTLRIFLKLLKVQWYFFETEH